MTRGTRGDSLTAVPGVRVAHATAASAATGVTVVRFDRAVPTVVRTPGGTCTTYDTASLRSDATFGRRWALFFAGGSLHGLDAARGVRDTILGEGGGHTVFQHPRRVAPVSGATLFDLPRAAGPLEDYAALGAQATRDADRRPVPYGRVGAGAGATLGKYLGRDGAQPGGLGSAAGRLRGGGTVGVLAVVNAVGAVRDPRTGRWIAGARRRGRLVPPSTEAVSGERAHPTAAGTTLVAVVTDVPLDRPALERALQIAEGGVARTVVPIFTATDGDVLFGATTGEGRRPPIARYPGAVADRVGIVAADLIGTAIRRAVGGR